MFLFCGLLLATMVVSAYVGWRGGLLRRRLADNCGRAWVTAIVIVTPLAVCGTVLETGGAGVADPKSALITFVLSFLIVGFGSAIPSMLTAMIAHLLGARQRAKDEAGNAAASRSSFVTE